MNSHNKIYIGHTNAEDDISKEHDELCDVIWTEEDVEKNYLIYKRVAQ